MSTVTDPGTNRIKLSIRDSWDRGAPSYDDQYGHGIKSTEERTAWKLLLRRLLPPETPLRVLDVGTGTGALAILLAEIGHTVTGIDISKNMLRVAQAKATHLGLTVDFCVADADVLPFPDACFDAVISRHVLWTLFEPERSVREWARVTRPGGRIIAIDGVWQSDHPLDRVAMLLGTLLGNLHALVRRRRKRQEHRYPDEARGQLPLWHVHSADPACNVFARAGLSGILSEDLTWLDKIERHAMPLVERLKHRYRRYLVEAKR